MRMIINIISSLISSLGSMFSKKTRVRIDWLFNLGNDPVIVLPQVRRFPTRKPEYYCRQVGPGQYMYIDTWGPYVHYYFQNWKNTNGFGGQEFLLPMRSGYNAYLKGPWSSRCGAVNGLVDEPFHSVEVIDGGFRMSILVSVLEPLLPWSVKLIRVEDSDGDIRYRVVPKKWTPTYLYVWLRKPQALTVRPY